MAKESDKDFVHRLKTTRKLPPTEQDADRLRKLEKDRTLNRIVKKAKERSKKSK